MRDLTTDEAADLAQAIAAKLTEADALLRRLWNRAPADVEAILNSSNAYLTDIDVTAKAYAALALRLSREMA